MQTTTTTIFFNGDKVRYHGLTVNSVLAMIAEVECPVDVTEQRDCYGQPAIEIRMTTEQDEIGDAASDELVDCVRRAGFDISPSYC